MRRYILEGLTLVIAAVLCATVANALASRERKMALVGLYPNAQKVPAAPAEALPAPSVTAAAATTSDTGTVVPVAPTVSTAAQTTATVAPPPGTATSTSKPATAQAPSTAKPVPLAPAATATSRPAPVQAPTTTALPAPRLDVSKFQPHPDKPYIEVAYDDVAALHAAGALFLDARRTSVYEQGHIAGARPFSVWESDIDQKVNKLFEERGDPREQARPIVAYCSGGECEDSHMLAQKLWGIQFNNVYVYKDGFPDWQKHGGTVRTGTAP